MYDNESKFKLHFHSLRGTYGIKRKLTSVKNPQVNAIIERIHVVFRNMLGATELDMAKSVKVSDIWHNPLTERLAVILKRQICLERVGDIVMVKL
jgi:hypothetical protein